jgi:uncharacterized protein YecT (DUF1311 family)
MQRSLGQQLMRLIAFLGLLFATFVSAGQETWLYQYPVTFGSLDERTWILLGDGTAIDLDYGEPKHLSFDDVAKWTKGEQLLIAYSTEEGEVLVDPKSNEWIQIAHGPQRHSIDLMKDACLAVEMTTPGMAGCHAKALELWEAEIARCYQRLERSLDSQQMATVVEAQKKWIEFRQAETAAIGAIYTEGTISQIFRASAVEDLVRQRARDLQIMIQGGM